MKRTAYTLIPLLVAVSCSMAVQAQKDSSTLDIGSVRLKKQNTQYITIKGAALEKMPFANLAEAINVWLYGAYSNAASLVYVVDGNIVPDVNAWSIYDIEEVVLVQSALTQLTGNTGQQQLVLITTRRRPSKNKFALDVAGASALVNTDYLPASGGKDVSSLTNLYHQYHVSGTYNREKVQMGLTANWLRDVMPGVKNDSTNVVTPLHINRFRLNAWVQAKLGRSSSLYFNINATPENAGQYIKTRSTVYYYNGNGNEKQLVISPYLRLRTDIGPGWQNNFSVSYQSFHSKSSVESLNTYAPPGSVPMTATQTYLTDTVNDRIVVIRDHMSKTFHAHNWTIEPAIYLQYAHLTIKSSEQLVLYAYSNGGLNPPSISRTFYSTDGKGHIFTGAPSLDFSYKNILSFGGGGFAYLPPSGTVNTKASIFPFAHFSLDLLKWHNTASPSSLQLFASLARNYNYTFRTDALDDLTGASATTPPTFTSQATAVFGTGISTLPTFQSGELFAPHTVWTAGLGFRKPDDKLVANYYFEKRGFTAPTLVPVASGPGFIYITTYPLLQAYTHHINVMAKLLTGPSVEWQSGITATTIEIKGTMPPYPQKAYTTGDIYGYTSFTGGWVNRFSCKGFFAGFDLLYHINERQPSGNSLPYQYKKISSVDLQHVYAGCKIRVGKYAAEVYLSSRNLLQNTDSDLTDRRRYYGAGFITTL